MRMPRRRWPRRRAVALVAVLLVLAGCALPAGGPGEEAPGHPMLVEVYAAGSAGGGADQYVRLYNPGPYPLDLAGWSLGDGKVRALFPSGAAVGPGQTFYAARSAAGFEQVMAFPPDAVWGPGASGGPPRMNGGAGWLLRREAGAVVLRGPQGQVVDQLFWGSPAGGAPLGWRGSGAPPPAPGEVLDRARDEAGWGGRAPGPYRPDTDSAADWRQGSDWLDRRVLRPGQTFFPYPSFTVRGVTAYASPDSSYRILAGLIDGARERIDLNVYSFTNLLVAGKLAEAAGRGVQVRLLMEASSLGALSDQERFVAQLVHEAGGEVRWIMNQPGAGVVGRYVFNHAKYGVVDGRAVFVQSENLGRSGVPVDNSAGNRGWGVVVQDPGLARYLSRVFAADWNPGHGDIFPYREDGDPFGPPPPGSSPETELPTGQYPHPFRPVTVTEPVRVTPVLAPDHALLETKGLTGLIRGAQRSILVQQMYIQVHCAEFLTG
ncbi:MAG: phospholipase D-like domain-containing protein [Bacillota bacterium]